MRQRNSESGAPSEGGSGVYTPVMSSDNFVGDGKAKACTSGFVGRKRHEKRLERLGRHTAAVVGDSDNDLIQVFPDGEGDTAIFSGGFEGIFEQIQKCLF